MASRCEYCGAELRPNSMFCLSCGQLVTSGRAPVAAPLPAPVASTRPPLERTAPPVVRPAVAPAAAPAATPVAAPAPAPAPAAAAPVPAAAPAPPSPVVANATFVVAFSTGQRLVVDGPVVVGRRPEQAAAEAGSAAFAVTDPERSTSRAHAAFAVVDGQLVVTDRGSGNGTVVHRAGVEIECVEGRPVALRPGDELELGSVGATVAAV
ncbi:pSer/pThr/pTyr-binding forkhead associated (FHA) protein [Frigoribacterium sp. PhB107]|uniref:FHA domain-containing protein n=1 Tax=Frigoribacterium sp. PhB107 TaxID=2485172 RepID=UPI000F4984B3|nr:FHA domain-containing protein [Frigoribacterium sp. PhB107]ROP75285.1 pSer/pThr/pTyr-binding forkhead associated (FHA) protein [Frigoribacterium sp. PhB107]